ncbi:MAG: AI-2E family transporter [Longimicrobiales bacterium]
MIELRHDRRSWGLVYAIAASALLGLFLYAVRDVLTPFVLLPALLLLLWPYAGRRGHAALVVLITILGLLWIMDTTGFLLAPFILALVLAYIFNPAVRWLERHRVPRSPAVLLLALPGIVLLVIAITLGAPALGEQVERMARQAPSAIAQAAAWLDRARLRVLNLDLPLVPEQALRDWIATYDAARVEQLLLDQKDAIARRAWAGILGVGRGLGTVLAILGYVVLTPILAFYLLRDYETILARLRAMLPARTRAGAVDFFHEYDRLLSHFLRGQLLAATVVGILTWLGLWVLRFPYSGVVGAVAGVFNLVPYLGLIVSLIPAVLIALLSGSILASLGKVAIVFAVVQVLDGSVIGPRIVGGSVGLHPVWVMLAIAVGSFFFGFIGLLLAVPGAVLIKLLLRSALARYEHSSFYAAALPPSDPAPPPGAGA